MDQRCWAGTSESDSMAPEKAAVGAGLKARAQVEGGTTGETKAMAGRAAASMLGRWWCMSITCLPALTGRG